MIFIICLLSFSIFYIKKRLLFSGWHIPIFCFCTGYFLTIIHTQKNYPTHFAHHSFSTYEANIISEPFLKNNFITFDVEIEKIKTNQGWQKSIGKCNVVLDFKTNSLNYGQKLLIHSTPNLIKAPLNPSEFNFQQYYAFHNIEHNNFLKGHEIIILPTPIPFSLIGFAQNSRKTFISALQKNIASRQFSIISALLLGEKHYIEKSLKEKYAGAGAMHILAVSGLHVGILFGFIQLILSKFDFFKQKKWLTTGILLLFLWSYAYLTGLSPSILRACSMFSFIVIAKAIQRNSNIYNTLALSAFCLLLCNPYFLMEVGFQLSYLAVVGIVLFYEKFYQLFTIKNQIINYLWQLSCVSIACQLTTTPLTLLYFHQFPSYFLITNLVVIPLTSIIVIIGFISLAFIKITFLFKPLCLVLNFLTELLNNLITYSQNFPLATIKGIDISIVETFVLYIGLFIIALFFIYKRLHYLLIFNTLVILLSIFWLYEITLQNHQHHISIYNTPNYSNLVFCKGREHFVIADEKLLLKTGMIEHRLLHNFWKEGSQKQHYFSWNNNSNFQKSEKNYSLIYWQNQSFLIIKHYLTKTELSQLTTLDFDCIIIQHNQINSKQLAKLKTTKIIFDSSNSIKFCKKIKNEFSSIYFVPLEGFWRK